MTQNGFKDLHFKLDDQDIIIRMKPILDHQNNWTGDVNLQVIDSVHNPLSDRGFATESMTCKFTSPVQLLW